VVDGQHIAPRRRAEFEDTVASVGNPIVIRAARRANVDGMIITDRLHLRHCRRADVDAVLAYRSRPDVARHLSAGVWTREKTKLNLAAYEDALFSGVGDELVLLVETLAGAKVIGEVGLVWLDSETMTAEVGYVFNPESGGYGFATEAVAAVIRIAFDSLGFSTMVATTDEDNLPSRALCERLGMRLTVVKPAEDRRDVQECVYTVDNPNSAR